MPATSQEPSGRFAFQKRISSRRLWSTKEGVGETSGQTAGPQFSTGLAPSENRLGRRKKVFFIGADPEVRNFTGVLRQLRFGPDVFADALVPGWRLVAARGSVPKYLKTLVSPAPGSIPAPLR